LAAEAQRKFGHVTIMERQRRIGLRTEAEFDRLIGWLTGPIALV